LTKAIFDGNIIEDVLKTFLSVTCNMGFLVLFTIRLPYIRFRTLFTMEAFGRTIFHFVFPKVLLRFKCFFTYYARIFATSCNVLVEVVEQIKLGMTFFTGVHFSGWILCCWKNEMVHKCLRR